MKKITTLFLLVAGICATSFAQAPVAKTITDLRTNDANMVPNNGDTVTRISTTGVVYGPNTNKYRTTGGLTFILNDHQAGIKVYSTRSFGYTLHEGDSVLVIGTVADFKGEAEIDTHAGDTIQLLGQGHVDTPAVVAALGVETDESRLIQLNNIDMDLVTAGTANGDWGIYSTNSYFTAWFGGASLHANNAIYIDSFESSALFFWPKPSGIYNIAGFGAQHYPSNLNTSQGYQIIPRDTNDFKLVTASPNGVRDLSSSSLQAYVYPNPASTKINAAFIYDNNEMATVRITDLTGRVVRTENVQVEKGENVITLSTAGITEGIYILDLATSNKSLISKINITK